MATKLRLAVLFLALSACANEIGEPDAHALIRITPDEAAVGDTVTLALEVVPFPTSIDSLSGVAVPFTGSRRGTLPVTGARSHRSDSGYGDTGAFDETLLPPDLSASGLTFVQAAVPPTLAGRTVQVTVDFGAHRADNALPLRIR